MAKYNWTFATIGGTTRVKIQSGEDIRHLNELDEKLWTVLSCPVTGLEISEDSLKEIDTDKDGKIHIREVVQAAEWLCNVLQDPELLIKGKGEVRVTEIRDESIRTTAEKIAKEGIVTLDMVNAAIANAQVDTQSTPEPPYSAEVIAAYKNCKEAYNGYFATQHLQQIGLAQIPEGAVAPGIPEAEWLAMEAKITEYEASVNAINSANTAALEAVRAEYLPLRRLLLLTRDFYTLLCNFVSFQDFYAKHGIPVIGNNSVNDKWAIFQAGTLVIDQRACHLCLRVNDISKHDAQATASGMFLIYCNCTYQATGEKMQIVAAMTVGDIRNLKVGKNALFYDRMGRDWEAVVVKIIDNPISIGQAFWSPYRKFGEWVTNLINKSAADKENKAFTDFTAKVQENSVDKEKQPQKLQAFDIAKFAGIFAAIGMAVGYIGAFLTSIGGGIKELFHIGWWAPIVAVVALALVISGPAMIMAWFKLRKRNLSPLLNANGWAVNADAIVSVLFGGTLTEQAQFPLLKTKHKCCKLKKGRWGWIAIAVIICILLIVSIVLYLLGYVPCWCC